MTDRKSDLYEIIEFNLTVSGRVHFEMFHDSRRYEAPHWHDALEIISLTEGELLVSMEGQQYRLQEGNCIILPAYSVHSTLSTRGNSSLLLQVPVDAFSECIASLEKTRIFCDPFTRDPERQKCLERIKYLLRKIMETQTDSEPAAGLRSACLVLEIMYVIYTGLSSAEEMSSSLASNRKNRERMSSVLAYTEAHYNEPVSLEDVAGELHLQVNYFCHLFKENTGMTYLQYLNEYRLGRIYQDLMETDMPLKFLLEKHGFTNYKLFRRMFFDRFGATPGELRKNAGNAAAEGKV